MKKIFFLSEHINSCIISRIILFTCIIFFISSCAPNLKILTEHLNLNMYNKCVEEVSGNYEMESHLAALILEDAISNTTTERNTIIDNLAAAGLPGRAALNRLSEKNENHCILAQIALHRSSLPKQTTLANFLSSSSGDIRFAAVKTWAKKLSHKQLAKLVVDTDPRVRRAAISGFDEENITELFAVTLRDALKRDPASCVRAAAARRGKALGQRDHALDALRIALLDRNQGVRFAAIRGLGDLNTIESIALIRDHSAGKIETTSIVAAAELCKVKDKKGIILFSTGLNSENPTIKRTALAHLYRANLENADLLIAKMLLDKSPQVVLLAASMLMQQPKHLNIITKVLQLIVEKSNSKKQEARNMLALLGDAKSIKQIKEEIESYQKSNEGKLITLIIKVAKVKQLRPIFVSLLDHTNTKVRIAAATAILKQQNI